MGIDKHNAEHYRDPTAYAALEHIRQNEKRTRERPIVYICSPLKGDIAKNMKNACKYCKYAVHVGAIPVAVHLLFPQFMDDNDHRERELAISMGLQLLQTCSALWIFGGTVSEGMKREIAEARRLGVPIRRWTDNSVDSVIREVMNA